MTYPIPGNDDAIRSVSLLTRVVADAVADGLMSRAGASEADQKPADDQFTTIEEPLPEWERDLLEGTTAPAEEVQESPVTDAAQADADIAEVAPDADATAEAVADATPEVVADAAPEAVVGIAE